MSARHGTPYFTAKKQPAFQEASVLAFECTWDKLLHEIDDLLNQLGFVYFTYSVLTRGQINSSSEAQKQRWNEGSDIVGSLPDAVIKTIIKMLLIMIRCGKCCHG